MGFISFITVFIYIVYLLGQLESIHNDKMDKTDNYTTQLTVTAFNLLKEASFGTRNCVPDGNVTLYEENLGHLKHLDSCCRRHHQCPQVEPEKTEHNATNLGWYRSYKCDCEEDLMRCLKKKITNAIKENISEQELRRIHNFGRVYFNEYGIYARCFRERPQPICNTFYLWLNSYRCSEYTYLNGYGGPKMHFFHLPIWGDVPVDEEHSQEAVPPYAALAPLPGPGSGEAKQNSDDIKARNEEADQGEDGEGEQGEDEGEDGGEEQGENGDGEQGEGEGGEQGEDGGEQGEDGGGEQGEDGGGEQGEDGGGEQGEDGGGEQGEDGGGEDGGGEDGGEDGGGEQAEDGGEDGGEGGEGEEEAAE